MREFAARVYIAAVVAAGAASFGYGVYPWQCANQGRFLLYCLVAVVASRLKVPLPTITTTMSMTFLLILIGIADLSLPETMAMGCLGMLVQCLFGARKRPRTLQVLFSVAGMSCSILAGYTLYHAPVWRAWALAAPLLMLLACGAYFLVNTASMAVLIGLTGSRTPWRVWRDAYFWSFPYYLVGAAAAWFISAAGRLLGWQTAIILLPILYAIYRTHLFYVARLEEQMKHADQQRQHAQEMVELHRRTITALALAIEAKDETTHDHLRRVEVYALAIGEELGLPEPELEALRAAALLHDIGKLAVPEHIITKPGRLTPDEFEKMKIHPIVGAEILEQVRFPYAVAPIVRAHHEKWDGSGYPDGLAGEQIPIGARILAAVDCLDALASDRQYRRALPLEEAIRVVQEESGRAFDPRVVEVLVRRCFELEERARNGGHPEKPKLSTNLKVERGAAPAAGFESNGTRDLLEFQRAVAGQDGDFAGVCSRLREVLRYSILAGYERRGNSLTPVFLDGEDWTAFAAGDVPLGEGLSGWVAQTGKPILNGNPTLEPAYLRDPARVSQLRSALAIPLRAGDRVLGVLALYRQEPDAFSADELSLLQSAAGVMVRLFEDLPPSVRQSAP